MKEIEKAIDIIRSSDYTVAFTGAGISVESGIPPFRGEGGLWEKYDPECIDLNYFYKNPDDSWKKIYDIFYRHMRQAKPNKAHFFLKRLEDDYALKTVITQNIDALHHKAGNSMIVEFHGTVETLSCISCGVNYKAKPELFVTLPPVCEKCGAVLKPDFVFFGQAIPEEAFSLSVEAGQNCDVMIIIGAGGEVMPAGNIPFLAKENGARIIEINTDPSVYTFEISDVFIQRRAVEASRLIEINL